MEHNVLRILGRGDAPAVAEEAQLRTGTITYETVVAGVAATTFYPLYQLVYGQQQLGRRPLTSDAFDALVAQATASARTAERASASISVLLECTLKLTETAARLSNIVHRVSVPVNTLPRADLRLLHPPLFVSVEQDDEDSFIAEVAEAGVVGYGDSVAGAVERAVSALCELYDEIATAPATDLGPRPRRWQVALNALIERAR